MHELPYIISDVTRYLKKKYRHFSSGLVFSFVHLFCLCFIELNTI